jgi:hypothetical protein
MQYKGLPIAILIVNAKYSAMTPNAVKMQPEKKVITMTSEVHPSTRTCPVNLAISTTIAIKTANSIDETPNIEMNRNGLAPVVIIRNEK